MIDFSRVTILFGGSFDPVHRGHLHVATYALGSLPGAQLLFVPAGQSPGKNPPQASPEDRLRWLHLATDAGAFQVWNTELERPGLSFTVDTLKEAHRLGAARERLYWLLGSDAYASFAAWKQPEEIRCLARLLVVNRPGAPAVPTNADDTFVAIPPHPASSTEIRTALSRGLPAPPELPAAVQEDIGNLLLLHRNPYARGSA